MNTPTPQTWKVKFAAGNERVVIDVTEWLKLTGIARDALRHQGLEEEQLSAGLKELRSRTVTRDDVEQADPAPWDNIEGMAPTQAPSHIPNTTRGVGGSQWRMPFGKHKGKLLGELDRSYLEWCLRQEWLRSEARQHIEEALADLNYVEDGGRPRWKQEE